MWDPVEANMEAEVENSTVWFQFPQQFSLGSLVMTLELKELNLKKRGAGAITHGLSAGSQLPEQL